MKNPIMSGMNCSYHATEHLILPKLSFRGHCKSPQKLTGGLATLKWKIFRGRTLNPRKETSSTPYPARPMVQLNEQNLLHVKTLPPPPNKRKSARSVFNLAVFFYTPWNLAKFSLSRFFSVSPLPVLPHYSEEAE